MAISTTSNWRISPPSGSLRRSISTAQLWMTWCIIHSASRH